MVGLEWTHHPKILELNAWAWLDELSAQFDEPITLKNIPDNIYSGVIKYFDVIWLMGIWKRSQESKKIARNHELLKKEFKGALTDLKDEDIIGSPYSICSYNVDEHFGGIDGLKQFREKLSSLGKMIILDYVPNHSSIDSPWLQQHPEYYLHGTELDIEKNPNDFFRYNGQIFPYGRDPYFPPWTDTIQLNSFSLDYRRRSIEEILKIGQFCDGIRCDMAMLLCDSVFVKTWGDRGGKPLEVEFWQEIIDSVKNHMPKFKFFAEVYWDMEWKLQQQGFDFCYDKRMYDRLLNESPASINAHLRAEWDYQKKLLRFVENHDEKRAAISFGIERSLAAATITMTTPGARLVNHGQSVGRKIRVPVQLGRLPKEIPDNMIVDYYKKFYPIWQNWIKDSDKWRLCSVIPYDINLSNNPFIAYRWSYPTYDFFVIINYCNYEASGYLPVDKDMGIYELEENNKFIDHLSDEKIECTNHDLRKYGFYINLPAWGIKLFSHLKPAIE